MIGRDMVSIFLIDDNSIVLSIVKRFLQAQDAVVIVGATPSSEETLKQLQALQPDVVLIDPFTPGASGLEGISRLRAVVPGSRIIVTTLLDVDGYRQAVLAAGADDFVPKGSLAVDLLPAIRRIAHDNRVWKEVVRLGEMAYAPMQV